MFYKKVVMCLVTVCWTGAATAADVNCSATKVNIVQV